MNKKIVLATSAAIAVAVGGASVGLAGGGGDKLDVVAADSAVPLAVLPQEPGSDPVVVGDGQRAAVPVPIGPPPPQSDGKISIGETVEVGSEPKVSFPVPVLGDGYAAKTAQINTSPAPETASGVTFMSRYFAEVQAPGGVLALTVQEPSPKAKTLPLTIPGEAVELKSGAVAYDDGNSTAFERGGTIVIVSGGTAEARLAFASELTFR